MKRIKEVIVVEGKNDTARLHRLFDCDTIETSGTDVNQKLIDRIHIAQKRRGVIIFTDPDAPGNRIRDKINRKVLKVIETEINESKTLPFLIRYDKILKGKKIDKILFTIRPRTSNHEIYFGDVQNPIMYEELMNELIKGDTSLEEIRNRQADTILNRDEND